MGWDFAKTRQPYNLDDNLAKKVPRAFKRMHDQSTHIYMVLKSACASQSFCIHSRDLVVNVNGGVAQSSGSITSLRSIASS